MTTHAIIVFADNYFKKDIDENIDKTISRDFDYIKKGNQVYIHANGYPSGILPALQEYLQTPGAKSRRYDNNYLSAWFVGYYTIFQQLSACSALFNEELKIGEYDNYIENYKPSWEDFKEVGDFLGVGLINNLECETDYYYVITQGAFQNFNIWIYNWKGKFIDFVCSDDDLNEYVKEDWWD